MLDHEASRRPEARPWFVSQLGWVAPGKTSAPTLANESAKSDSSHVAEVSIFVNRFVVPLYANSPAFPPTKKKDVELGARASKSRYVRPLRSGT